MSSTMNPNLKKIYIYFVFGGSEGGKRGSRVSNLFTKVPNLKHFSLGGWGTGVGVALDDRTDAQAQTNVPLQLL